MGMVVALKPGCSFFSFNRQSCGSGVEARDSLLLLALQTIYHVLGYSGRCSQHCFESRVLQDTSGVVSTPPSAMVLSTKQTLLRLSACFDPPAQCAPALPEVKAHALKMAIHRCARHRLG
eukprot:6490451-Amphidinium_carterae.2